MGNTSTPQQNLPTVGVGAVIWNAQGEVLLIKRARPPRQGEWSIPGGKVEMGESLHAALKREVHEETGLEIEIVDFVDAIELEEQGHRFVLNDFTARHVCGEARAGSDAREVRWAARAELERYALWAETRRIIALSAQQLALD